MQRTKRIVIAAAAAAVSTVSFWQYKAEGATFTWDGGGANASIGTGLNWIGGVAPGTAGADDWVFDGTVDTNPLNDYGPPRFALGATSAFNIFFNPTAGAFVLGGSTITMGNANPAGGNITNNSLFTQTFATGVSPRTGIIAANTADIDFNGSFSAGNTPNNQGGRGSTIAGAHNVVFNGGIFNGGFLVIGGTGTTAFTGTCFINTDNSATGLLSSVWNGTVTINSGALQISNSNALGDTATTHGTTVAGGTNTGALQLNGANGNLTVAEPITLAGRTVANSQLQNIAGNNTLSNVITGAGGSTFNFDSDAGTLNIASINATGTTGARFFTFAGASAGIVNGVGTSSATATTIGLNKTGTGTWTLAPGVAANFLGNTTVSGGTLVIQPNAGTTSSAGGNAIGNNPGSNVSVAGGATLDLSAYTSYSLQAGNGVIAGQKLTGNGTVKVNGTLNRFGDNTIAPGTDGTAGTLTIQGNLSLSNEFALAGNGLKYDLSNVNTVGGGVNDLLNVTGDLDIDTPNGAIPVIINPLNLSLANGQYQLINYSGNYNGSAPSTSSPDFSISGAAAGTTRQSFTVDTSIAHQVDLDVSGAPAVLTWVGDGSANAWDVVTSPNWKSSAPTDPNHFYNFDQVTFDDSSVNKTVNLNTTVTPGAITATTASTYTITGSGTIGGGTGVTKNGAGTFIIANSGSNNFAGAITINQGTLQFGDGGSDANLGSGSITNNGALVVNSNQTVAIPQAITGTGQFVNAGTGTTTLSASNGFGGGATVQGGQLIAGNAAALGTGSVTVLSGGELALFSAMTVSNPVTINGTGVGGTNEALHAGGSAVVNYTGPITLASDAAIKVDGGATFTLSNSVTGTNTNLTLNADTGGTGLVSGPISIGTGGLTVVGAGQWTLTNPSNSFSGGAAVTGGTLQFGNGTAAGTTTIPGVISVNGGEVVLNNNGSYAVSSTITGTGSLAVGSGGGTVTLTGNLTGFTGTLTTVNSGTNSELVVPVATGATSVFITDTNLLGNGQGIIHISNSNAIANGTASFESDVAQGGGTGRLEVGNSVNLNFGSIILHPRNNNTPTILATDGNNTIQGPMRIDNGGSTVTFSASLGASLTFTGSIHPATATEAPSTAPGSSRVLAFGGAGNGTFSGTITNRPDEAGTVGIIVAKNGPGTWFLTGTNDYIGNPTGLNTAEPTGVANIIQNGTLDLVGPGAWAPVLANTITTAYTDIQGGRLTFDYSPAGSTDPAGTISAMLAASYTPTLSFNNTTGIIRSTTGTGTLGLGITDDGVSKVTVGYTVFGDANLDGKVNAQDFDALAANYGATSGKFWYQGDFNYDGVVNVVDFNILAENYNQAAPIPTAAPVLAPVLGTLVPEPVSLGLLGLAGLSLRRRRGRN